MIKSVVACIGACPLLLASASAWAQEDPTAPGPFTVQTAQYFHGNSAFSCPPAEGCGIPSSEILAEVYYPSNLSAGPFPLVVFLHGRHSPCYDPVTGSSSSSWDNGCDPPFVPIPSHRGYDYVGRVLASHGYIVASISANGINGQDFATADQGITDRAHLVEAHIGLWDEFNTIGSAIDAEPFASSFIGAVDMNNIGTMGHSRGGDGVVKHFALFSGVSPHPVHAVLPIAPTNFSGEVIPGVDLGVMLPYCDGDVFTLEGSLFYDRSRYLVANDESTKLTFLSLGSNHNFFNSVWTPECWTSPGTCWTDDRGTIPTPATADDAVFSWSGDSFCDASLPANGRLSAAEQRAVGTAYVAGFFRAHLQGETELLPFLRNDVPPPAPLDANDLYTAYQAPASRRLDLNRFENSSELSLTTLAGTGGVRGNVIANSLAVYERCGFSVSDPCFSGAAREVHLSNFFFLDPTLSRARTGWDAPADTLVNELPVGARDVSRFNVLQFRVGVDYVRTATTASPASFTVTLSDGVSSASVSTDSQLGSNDLFYPPGGAGGFGPISPVMNSLRLPLSLFSGVNLANLERVTFQYNGTSTGAVLLADLAFVEDEEVVVEPPRPFCQASERFVVQRAGRVTSPDGTPAVTSSGSGLTTIDLQAQADGVLSVGPVRIGREAQIDGDVRSASTINVDSTATVTGAVVPLSTVSLPPLPSLPAFPPPTGGTINVNPGPPVTLAPGSYPTVNVNSGGTLRLLAGDYFFVNLTAHTGSRIEAVSASRAFVANTLAYRAQIVTSGGAPQPIFLGYAGSAALRLEAPFQGTLLAPNAEVFFGIGAGTSFRGTFQARVLNVNPQSSIECIAGPGGQGSGPTPTCMDGIRNGQETDVDCGGSQCAACDIGEQCLQNSDCTTSICTGGVCQPPPGSVTASFAVTSNWGSGYCVTLRVTNNASIPTTSWNIGFNTNFSTIYSRWNGVFSGSSGALTVGPVAAWNAVVPPGTTNTSVGFCANRTFPGSGSLPFITSATGTY